MTSTVPAEVGPLSSPTLRATLWMSASAVTLAVSAVLIRAAGETLDTFVIVFFRNLISVVLMAPLLFWPRPLGVVPHRPKLLMARAVFAFFTMSMWFGALAHLPTGEAVALNFTAPVFTTILAALFIGERVRLHRLSAVAVGIVGVLIILQPGFSTVTAYHALPLAAAMTMAAGSVMIRQLAQSDHPNVIIFYTSLFVMPLVTPFAIANWQTPNGTEWMLLIAIGITTTLTHQCMTRAFKTAEASFVAGISFLRLPLAVLAAWLVFDEWPKGAIWLGGMIIVAANVYIAHRELTLARRSRISAENDLS
ncbi:DMT family transporter [Rhodobium gokarnense]|uniref:Drug/metabolite transporter (DMT)-like permease n=1 Tax=Rhodobium gokarnense TaxID=364296 RepID=A0ABT3HC42_9HYPH|nr:DMT family transporter [Rhodobium gokarnense]MCW2307968.1 drug/metabolite transporter (DMT)-like permease [Rhodobium gokarnense]